jgi:hypothetical protein
VRIIPFEKAESWGLIQWAQPLIGVLFDASSDIYEYITNQIMDNHVLRLQFKLDRQLIPIQKMFATDKALRMKS